jgi:hypothetical protein
MTIYLFRFGGSLPGGEVWQTGVHMQNNAPIAPTAADAVPILQTFVDHLWNSNPLIGNPALGPFFTAGVTLTQGTVYVLNQSTGRVQDRADTSFALAGAAAGSMLPQGCAEVVSFRSGASGVRNRGRSYMPPVAVAHVTTAGRLTTTVTGAFSQAWGGAVLGAQADEFTAIIWSTQFGARVIDHIDCGDVVDSQRRRRDKLSEVREVSPIVTIAQARLAGIPI